MAHIPHNRFEDHSLGCLDETSRDRFQHRYILGKTGVGKSTTLLNLILADIKAGDGVFYIDPHGEDADRLLDYIPKRRRRDVILFDPSDLDNPAPINILENIEPSRRPLMASSIVDTFKSVWGYDQMTTPVLDQILYNTTAALLDAPKATLFGLFLMLNDDQFRETVITTISDPVVHRFWINEFAALSSRERRETSRSTLNKIGMLMADPRVRNTFGYWKSAVRIEEVFQGKILIARLPQGRLGLQKTKMIGALLLARFHMLALGRDAQVRDGVDADTGPKTLRTCHVYLDECHHFGSGTLIEMVSGIRKFGVSLTLCHQYLDQLSLPLRQAVLGSIGTKIIFRVGLADAAILDREFPIDNTYPSVSELLPHTARISTPTRLHREINMPTLPKEQFPERALAIRRFNRRHHTRSRRRIEQAVVATLEGHARRGEGASRKS